MYVQLYFVIQFLVLFCLQYFCIVFLYFVYMSVFIQFYLVGKGYSRQRKGLNYYLTLCVCQLIMMEDRDDVDFVCVGV
jgi:hypothetical protein